MLQIVLAIIIIFFIFWNPKNKHGKVPQRLFYHWRNGTPTGVITDSENNIVK